MKNPGAPFAAVFAILLAFSLTVPAGAQFGKNKIQYEDFDWSIYHSPHFDVYYYEDEEHLLEKVVSFAESSYDELSRKLDYQIEDPTPLIFYKTHAEFEQNNIILGFIPEAVGAFASPVRNRMVLPVDMPDAELYELITHELVHIFQYKILFGNRLSRRLALQTPTWLAEGMASYYAEDESTSDEMFMRDAVVNDIVPPISEFRGGGFFAYRFGHAAFDYMEERWGTEGVVEFLYEFRSTIGGDISRALDRAFRIEPEVFNSDFRRWLREKYLPELVATGEPSFFGRRFLGTEGRRDQFLSPAVSPSGDLAAAVRISAGRQDVVLLDTRERRTVKNLTKGWDADYEYVTTQFLTSPRRMGSDLAFSPDGNHVAAFARRKGGRSLVLFDVLDGGIDRLIELEVQQPFGPAFHPAGTKIAFAGSLEGRFDIFAIDLDTLEIENLTDDIAFDGGPAYAPDGESVLYSSEVGAYAKLFRLDLETGARHQITSGESNESDVVAAADGLFFTSDRSNYENIYELDLETGELTQHTNAVTGCFMPALIRRADGSQGLVYAGFWKRRFDLYRGDLEGGEPVEEAGFVLAEPPPAEGLEEFEPGIQVPIDEENKEEYGDFHLFLEDADVYAGVTSDNLFLSQSRLIFSDQLGDRRLFVSFDSVSSFSDFDVIYFDLSDRLQWGIHLFDQRTFFLGRAATRVEDLFLVERGRSAFRQTGARVLAQYPLDLYRRFEFSLGYIFREYDVQLFVFDEQRNETIPRILPREDDYPEIGLSFVEDTTTFAPWGPIAGRRWALGGAYAPDLDDAEPIIPAEQSDSSTLAASASLDFRQYIPVTRRSNFAYRVFAGAAFGDVPNVFFFGGFDDFRAADFREFVGDRAFYTNFEYRFPLIDELRFPFGRIQGIRGRAFLDVAGAWFDYAGQDFDFWDDENDRLADAVSAYGFGFTLRALGVDIHWDFSKRWDFDETLDEGFDTSFWIGPRF